MTHSSGPPLRSSGASAASRSLVQKTKLNDKIKSQKLLDHETRTPRDLSFFSVHFRRFWKFILTAVIGVSLLMPQGLRGRGGVSVLGTRDTNWGVTSAGLRRVAGQESPAVVDPAVSWPTLNVCQGLKKISHDCCCADLADAAVSPRLRRVTSRVPRISRRRDRCRGDACAR